MHDSLTQGDRPGIREDQIPNNGDDRLLDGCHPLAGRNHFGFIGVGSQVGSTQFMGRRGTRVS